MLSGNTLPNIATFVKRSKIVEHYAGSRSYGTALPTSDVDIRGIFVAPPISVRTPFFTMTEYEDPTAQDTKYYELSKYIQLAVNQNPNIIETLWVDEGDILYRTDAYDMIRQMRSNMLTRQIAATTSGYAFSQLKRIKGHNKWINNPQPVEKPKRSDFFKIAHAFKPVDKVITSDSIISPLENHLFVWIERPGYSWATDDGSLKITEPNEIDLANEKKIALISFNATLYEQSLKLWEQYWTWKKERNVVRAELEEKYAFDTKHALHLVRLLRMGEEALKYHEIRVKRPDAEELLSIRNGSWTYEQLIAYAEAKNDEINKLLETSKLPKQVDLRVMAQLILDVQDIVWSKF